MKLLLTGSPKTGKSTLVSEALRAVKSGRGFLTEEVKQGDKRTGFLLRDSEGRTEILAQTERSTPYQVGRFFVNPDALDTFLAPLYSFQQDDLLYIDEIGQMQLYSHSFEELTRGYLNAPNDFLGTITSIYEDDFTKQIRDRKDILLISLDVGNREVISKTVKAAFKNRTLCGSLPSPTQNAILNMAKDYVASRQYVSLYKLFNNAIPYLYHDRIRRSDGQHYLVEGFTDAHIVANLPSKGYVCDCPLFKGAHGRSMECSHIQAVKLSNLGSDTIAR